MPNPIDGHVEQFLRSRWTVERMRLGELGREEVDVCDLLFSQIKPEATLADIGILDDGRLLDPELNALADSLKNLVEIVDAGLSETVQVLTARATLI